MRTTEQRITALHQKTEALYRQRERDILSVLGVCSCCLSAALLWIWAFFAGNSAEVSGDTLTGASLLEENIGGYVMAAVLAFMAGTCITAVIIRRRNRK